MTRFAAAAPPAWLPWDGRGLLNGATARSAAALEKVVRQFDVGMCSRYDPLHGATYCNIFAWDVTRALGCEVPHWVDMATGSPTHGGAGSELDVNGTVLWLGSVGPRYGWQEAPAADAGPCAANGAPVLATWANPEGGHGHIAVVVPPYTGPGLHIAQAGSRCFYGEPLSHGFGDKPVQFWLHA